MEGERVRRLRMAVAGRVMLMRGSVAAIEKRQLALLPSAQAKLLTDDLDDAADEPRFQALPPSLLQIHHALHREQRIPQRVSR